MREYLVERPADPKIFFHEIVVLIDHASERKPETNRPGLRGSSVRYHPIGNCRIGVMEFSQDIENPIGSM